jgi:hypothetical protein
MRWISSGGQVTGTRSTVARAPSRSAATQNGAEWNLQAQQFQVAFGRNVFGNRKSRRVGFRVAAQEIEDTVMAGMFPGGEIRPGHGGLRRIAGAELLVVAVGGQPAEVRQLAFGHPALGQDRVHAVETEHDQAAFGDRLRGVRRSEHGQQPQSGQHDQRRLPTAARRHRGFDSFIHGDGGGRAPTCVAGLGRRALGFQYPKPAQQ